MAKDTAFKPKKSSARMIRILLTAIFIVKVVATILGTIVTLVSASSVTKTLVTTANDSMGDLQQAASPELMNNLQAIAGIVQGLGSALIPVGILAALILIFKFYVDYCYKMMEVERTEDVRVLRNLMVAKEAGIGNDTTQLIEFMDSKADSITSRSSREKKAIYEEIRAVHTLLENQGGTPNSPYARR